MLTRKHAFLIELEQNKLANAQQHIYGEQSFEWI